MSKVARNETAINQWLASQKEAMVALLRDTVNIASGSYDKAGVDAVGARFERFFEQHGLNTAIEPSEHFGDVIHVRLNDELSNERPVVLMGHRDTVFPKDEPLRRPFRIDNGRAYGPGVADMKAGLVMNAFVMAAFKRFGGAPAPLVAIITGDEELGSPFSRPIIERMGRGARAVLNSEPGRPSGNVVTSRKGGVFLRFEVTGRAAHAGINFEKGISAIGELAHKIVIVHALTDLGRGITVNVGLVKGGQSFNTTAPSAEGEIDVRYVKPDQREEMLAALQRIVDTATVPGTTARLEIKGEFPPLTPTPQAENIFICYQAAARDLGLKIAGEFTGGCADSGFTAAVGCPTLCGLGPVGGNAHTPEEYVEIDSIVPRAQTMALTILRML
jgi:glutamate carboxypeptidase